MLDVVVEHLLDHIKLALSLDVLLVESLVVDRVQVLLESSPGLLLAKDIDNCLLKLFAKEVDFERSRWILLSKISY